MPTERVVILIETVSNMAGVKQAQSGLLGFGVAGIAASVALGGLIMAGKAAVAISQEHFHAEQNLANAIKNRGGNTVVLNQQLQDFLQTNRDFIDNQNDVITGYATLIREGVKSKDVTRLMGTALNIAAVQGIAFSDAVGMIQAAEAGRNIGLKRMVGLTLQAIPAHATLAQKAAIVEANMKKVAAAYKHGTDTIDPLTRATNDLKTDWEKIAEKYGPALIKDMSEVAKGIDANMPSWIDWGTKVYNVASQLGTLLDMMDLAKPAFNLISNLGKGSAPTATSDPHKNAYVSGMTIAQWQAYEKNPQGMTVQQYVAFLKQIDALNAKQHPKTVVINVNSTALSTQKLALELREQIRKLDRSQR